MVSQAPFHATSSSRVYIYTVPTKGKKPRGKHMMAQSMTKLLLPAALLFLFLFLLAPAQGSRPTPALGPAAPSTGAGTTTKCALSSVSVETVNTGSTASTGGAHDPVFEVTVRNACACAVRAVALRSEGFASSVAMDPRLFRRDEARGDYYVVGGGRRIESGAEVRFRYAWDRAFRMAPAAVRDDCS